ncbi:MAG: hypothetical protein M3522_09330 [Actinomycetota bacterium]|nr:hypothetical protein [Actinomycetota bacterium]
MIDPRAAFDVWLTALAVTLPRVGDHEAPANRTPPYLTAYRVGGMTDGSMGDPHGMPSIVVQVTATGASRQQAEMGLHRAREVTLGRTDGAYTTELAGPGWRVYSRELADGAGVDHEPGTSIYNAVERYRLHLTFA